MGCKELWRKGTLHVAIIHKLLLRSTCLDRTRSLIEAERCHVKNGANFLICFLETLWRKLFLHSEWEMPLKSALFPQYIFWKIMSLSAFFFTSSDIYSNSYKSLWMLNIGLQLQELPGKYFSQTSPKGYGMSYIAQTVQEQKQTWGTISYTSAYVIWWEEILFPSP